MKIEKPGNWWILQFLKLTEKILRKKLRENPELLNAGGRGAKLIEERLFDALLWFKKLLKMRFLFVNWYDTLDVFLLHLIIQEVKWPLEMYVIYYNINLQELFDILIAKSYHLKDLIKW